MKEEEKQNLWLDLIIQECAIKDVVIITGNVQDEYLDRNEEKYLGLNQFLAKKMLNKGFKFVIFWTRCAGLTFPSKEMAAIFKRLTNSSQSEDKSNEGKKVVKEEDYDMGGDNSTNLKDEAEIQDRYTGPKGIAKLLSVYSKIRKDYPIAIIFDWTDFWTTDPQRLRPEEQDFFSDFCTTINSFLFSELSTREYEHPSSSLAFLTRQLGSIPLILYTNNSRAKIITIPFPEREDRREFVDRYYNHFKFDRTSNIQNKKDPKRPDYVDLFADQTDGLRIVDLQKILLLSNHLEENLPLEKLINLYKFGKKKSPWEDLSEERLNEVEEVLKTRVIGQDEAVHKVATTIVRAYMGLSGIQHSESRAKPKGVLFFAGPTGVGKTELAKATAEFLFRDENACIRFDMSEYMHEHSDQRLIGAPPGYVGFEDGGQLTNAIMSKPFCVLLFDEIEKAHPRILDIFLQVLEDGRLTDGRGQTVSFSESIIIFTTNLGSSDANKEQGDAERKKAFYKVIRNHFFETIKRPELFNRIGDNVVIFNSIRDSEFRLRIIENKVQSLIRDLKNRYGTKFEVSQEVFKYLMDKADVEYGGRGLINTLETSLLDPLAWHLFKYRRQLKEGKVIKTHLRNNQIIFTIDEI